MNEIANLLRELPDEFFVGQGGGWSFLNLCMRRDGTQWAGLHAVMEELCLLAIAAGFGYWTISRENWVILPGGMPFITLNIETTPTGKTMAAP